MYYFIHRIYNLCKGTTHWIFGLTGAELLAQRAWLHGIVRRQVQCKPILSSPSRLQGRSSGTNPDVPFSKRPCHKQWSTKRLKKLKQTVLGCNFEFTFDHFHGSWRKWTPVVARPLELLQKQILAIALEIVNNTVDTAICSTRVRYMRNILHCAGCTEQHVQSAL